MNTQVSRTTAIVTGLIGVAIMATYVIGLAKSIAEGFAGFEGALPFLLIVAFVLSLAVYNFYEQCIRKSKNGKESGLLTKMPGVKD